jgi:uncharacterized membrane protein
MELRVARRPQPWPTFRDTRIGRATVGARLVVGSATVLYALLLGAAAVVTYRAYQLPRLDLGDMVQAVWSSAHGHLLQTTTENGLQTSRLGGHVDPFLVLLVPLWWIWPSPLLLVLLQVAAVSLGALPVFWLARKHTGSGRAGAHFALAYLLYPATQFNAFTVTAGVHPVSFAVPLLLFAIWYLDNDRIVPFAVCAILAASTKEELGAAVAGLGLWYAVRRRRWGVGLTTFAVGMAVSLVEVLVVIPHYSPTGASPFAGRYAAIGGTPGGVAHTLVTDPAAFVRAVSSGHKALYLVLLFAPLLGLWALEPLLLLGAAPDLVINLLSAKPEQTTIDFQYTAGIVPFAIAAAIYGAARLGRRGDDVSLLCLAACGCVALVFSPVRFALPNVHPAQAADPVHVAKANALALVPAGVPTSASNQLGGYLSERRFIYLYPSLGRARWVIVDEHDPTYGDRSGYRRAIAALERNPRWARVFTAQGVEVFRRRVTPA